MGYFQQQTTQVPIDSDDLATAQDVVTVRKLTFEERQGCISKAMQVKTTAQVQRKGVRPQKEAAPSAEVVIDGALLALEQTAAALVAWRGPGFEGRPATRENLLMLPPDIVDKISAAADALNQGLSDEEKN